MIASFELLLSSDAKDAVTQATKKLNALQKSCDCSIQNTCGRLSLEGLKTKEFSQKENFTNYKKFSHLI